MVNQANRKIIAIWGALALLAIILIIGGVSFAGEGRFSTGAALTSCGPLAQEAELANLHGAMQVGEADGTKYVSVPRGTAHSNEGPHPDNRVDFCMKIAQGGTYAINATVSADDDSQDSFWVVINGQTYLWDTGHGEGFTTKLITDRYNGSAPIELNLEAGQVIISVHQRESEGKLDSIELIPTFIAPVPTDDPEDSGNVGGEIPGEGSPICGDLYQEAEAGTLYGNMQTGERGDASGTKFIFVPDQFGNAASTTTPDMDNRADFCVNIPEDGTYQIRAAADAPDDARDSLFVTVDGGPANGYLWAPQQGDGFVEDFVSDRGVNEVQNIYLTKGQHTVSFHHREPSTMLDWFRVELVSGSGAPVEPTATTVPPTATSVPPTATPEEIACNSLIVEAEDGKRFGNFTVGTHPDAYFGEYISVPERSGNALGGVIDRENRVEYCVNIEEAGQYQMMAWARTPNFHNSDSFYITVDGQPNAGIIWDVELSDKFKNSYVTARSINDRLTLNLSAGEHTITFHRREAETQLDRFELIPVSEENLPSRPGVTETPAPTEPPAQEPISQPPTPTTVPATEVPRFNTCSNSLEVEAERGQLKGAFQTRTLLSASGTQYIYVPSTVRDVTNNQFNVRDSASYCVIVPQSGTYKIMARTWAPDSGQDSFFVQVDGAPVSSIIWDVPNSTTFAENFVSDRTTNGPEEIYLDAGEHTITFYLRESGTMLDKFELIGSDNAGAPIEPVIELTTIPPTPTSTPTEIPPTPTPTNTPIPAACGPMSQEAEDGQLFGEMKSYSDGRASGGKSIGGVPSSSSLSYQDRVDFCVTIDEAGDYQILSNAIAPNEGSNSMYWTIGSSLRSSGSVDAMVWHMVIAGNNYVEQYVSNGGSVTGGNSPQIVSLEKGYHTLSFYLRESDVRLDHFEVIPAIDNGSEVPGEVLPPGGSLDNMLPSQTKINFSNAGLSGGIPNYPNTIEVTGRSESDIENAIKNAPPFTRIILPPGVINIGTIDINKSNVVLVGGGNGCGETILRFGSNDSGINVGRGGYTGSSINLTSDAGRNSQEITVSNGALFNIGDYVLIRQNDISDMFRADLSRNSGETWVSGNAMQMNKIIGKRGNTLRLEGGLNLDYKTSRNARVAKVNNMVTGVGIENLTLERTRNDSAGYESANIYFKFAANSWVKAVHSKNSMRSHITFVKSYKSEVRGSYIEGSYNHNGGYGYGVRLEGGTTDVLVENNIAKFLRHSFIAQIGANGNVFGYNYSTDPYGVGNGEIFTDLSVHGGFGHANLFEGNQAQNAKIDNYHGSSSANLFFRNRLEQDLDNFTYKSELEPKGASTPHIWVHENQYYNAFLANEIGFPGANRKTNTVGFDSGRPRANFTVCKYLNSADSERGCGRTRDTTVQHGTYDHLNTQASWDSSISDRQFPASAYLSSKPSFMGNSAWPAFGPDTLTRTEGEKMIPAKSRYLSGNFCHSGD